MQFPTSVAIALSLILGRGIAANAQSIANADSTRGFWINGALGAASLHSRTGNGALLASLDANLQHGPWLGSLRWHSLGNGIGGAEVRAFSLLGGVASTAQSFGYSAISVGVTAMNKRDCTAGCGLFADTQREVGPATWGVGLMVAGDAALRLGQPAGVGLGLTGFASVNTVRSFAGIGLEIGAGRWR